MEPGELPSHEPTYNVQARTAYRLQHVNSLPKGLFWGGMVIQVFWGHFGRTFGMVGGQACISKRNTEAFFVNC